MALLRLDRERRDRARLQPLQRDRLAGLLAIAVGAVVDALKLGLLSGTLDTGALARLKTVAAGLSEATGDPGLDTVMAEIDLRVEVELAKIGMPEGQAKT